MLSDREPPKLAQGITCSVDDLIQALPDSESEAFVRMLADKRWTATAIYDACVAEGYKVGRQTIGRHRNGSCRCGKT